MERQHHLDLHHNHHKHSASPTKHSLSRGKNGYIQRTHHNKKPCIKGALSNINHETKIRYFRFLNIRRSESTNLKWLPSIENFKRIIQANPILRMNWEYGIQKCVKTLPGKSGDDVLDMIDTACKTPPSFSHEELVGFPINSIFIEFMQN
jgi:hypothetical protein